MEKIERTRIGISGFEAFKQKKKGSEANPVSDESNAGNEIRNNNPETSENPVQHALNNDAKSAEESDNQGELGLNEPPTDIADAPQKKDWHNSVSDTMLMEWWNEFIDTQTMLTASLMRTLRPEMVDKEVVVKIPASKMEVLEAVKFPFNRFIAERSAGRLTSLRPEAGAIVEEERMPYTDKEKLDYLIRKYPELENMIKKLGLRLP